ncbi:Nucleotidyltransferase [Lentinus brumalis]|uniref:Nucleotidyltransferase n=1 Tax=Lentinus brumalis TaxID=2498619 RepID=A0A371DPM6_9APHY|nr:Nucleotidyltransferase [Polyporus brumalis]
MHKAARLLQGVARQSVAGPSRSPRHTPRIEISRPHPQDSTARDSTTTGHTHRTSSTRGRTRVPVGRTNLSYEKSPKYKDLRDARTITIKRLNELIHTHFGHDYTVHPFGSTCYGAGRPESDLDLCIFDDRMPLGFLPQSRRSADLPIYDVKNIADVLKMAKYERVSFVRATVPIVKFTDPETGLSCDVNVNNRLGCYNTLLFRRYCLLFPPLAPAIRKIKSWARHVGLNSPSTPGVPESFSSYALTLMVIAGLQVSRAR